MNQKSAFIVLQVFDLVSTKVGMACGGGEKNPVAIWLMGKGLVPWCAYKIVIITVVLFLISLLAKPLGKRVLACLNIFLIMVQMVGWISLLIY